MIKYDIETKPISLACISNGSAVCVEIQIVLTLRYSTIKLVWSYKVTTAYRVRRYKGMTKKFSMQLAHNNLLMLEKKMKILSQILSLSSQQGLGVVCYKNPSALWMHDLFGERTQEPQPLILGNHFTPVNQNLLYFFWRFVMQKNFHRVQYSLHTENSWFSNMACKKFLKYRLQRTHILSISLTEIGLNKMLLRI